MIIGFPNHPRKDILKDIDWIGKQGFDFVDLFLEEDGTTPEKVDPIKVKARLRKWGMACVGHTGWYLPIGNPVKSLRDAAVSEAEKYFKVFGKIGVEYVTIHANWPFSMFSDKEGIKWQIESLRKLVKSARKYNVKVMLELIDTKRDSVKNIGKILDSVPGLYFHLDVGHANLFGRNPYSYIKKFHGKLKHVHLHDNHGKKDEHLPLGEGKINVVKIIKTLRKYGYDGTITLEIFSKDRNLAVKSMRKLRKILTSN